MDRDGLEALTMRALGSELGVDPMAVYHYLPNKAAVLDGVADAVMREVPLDVSAGEPWQEQLAEFARGYRTTLRAHPNALPVVATRPDTSKAALAVIDAALGILLRAGAGASEAARVFHVASCFVMGHALDELGFPGARTDDLSIDDVEAAFRAALDDGNFPNLLEVIAASEDVSPDDTFETGLACLIAGFDARLSSGRASAQG